MTTEQMESNEGTGKEFELYTTRFSSVEERARTETWRILCEKCFQAFILDSDTVVDLGAGDSCFLQFINAKRKIAVDLSAHVRSLEAYNVEVLQIPATALSAHITEPIDVVFVSNFLEHLPDKRTLLSVLGECRKILGPKGRVIILQPNIRYTGPAYWDYIDHNIALTEHSLAEALEVVGFRVKRLIPRFLPYTAKSKLGHISARCPWLIGWYLKLPILWRLFGGQTLVLAEKNT